MKDLLPASCRAVRVAMAARSRMKVWRIKLCVAHHHTIAACMGASRDDSTCEGGDGGLTWGRRRRQRLDQAPLGLPPRPNTAKVTRHARWRGQHSRNARSCTYHGL
jgi:hypothetical protein